MIKLSFKPKDIVQNLIEGLPERAREVLINRYGLNKSGQKKTLEAIGGTYGITRERVRQIENYGIANIQKSDALQSHLDAFEELRGVIDDMGGIVPEDEVLDALSKDKETRNFIHFLLVLGNMFVYEKETPEFNRRWSTDRDIAEKVHTALKKICSNLSTNDLVSEAKLVESFLAELGELDEHYKTDTNARRWLSLSKQLGKNPLGEWGVASSPNVRAKGMRDYAYLVIKRNGSPMHFTEVAHSIAELFKRKAHVATCHNELIKDKRFVLVGRGLYALSEWGYSRGVVKDVIAELLKKHGSLTRDEVIDLVKKERYVKDNTILVNLQDASMFRKNANGKYSFVE